MGYTIIYYIFILPVSKLPFPILYVISDFLYIILYKIVGYRKKIVYSNLKNSFPYKNQNELKHIMSNFYKHLCDIMIESLKSFTISEKQLKKRMIIKNPELANQYAENGKSVIIVGGHFNNWEFFAQSTPLFCSHKCIGIYKPLSNLFFNNKMLQSREKFGLKMYSMRQTIKCFKNIQRPRAVFFASDQSSSNPKSVYWMRFLNQDTGVLFGVEKLSKHYNWPVLIYTINKIKRGYYEAEFKLLTDAPKKINTGLITETFTNSLQKDIINQPQYWLWSHKRWKHKRPT